MLPFAKLTKCHQKHPGFSKIKIIKKGALRRPDLINFRKQNTVQYKHKSTHHYGKHCWEVSWCRTGWRYSFQTSFCESGSQCLLNWKMYQKLSHCGKYLTIGFMANYVIFDSYWEILPQHFGKPHPELSQTTWWRETERRHWRKTQTSAANNHQCLFPWRLR